MKYSYTVLYVPDVPATIQFYKNCFGLRPKFITPEKDYEELETGGTTLAFASEHLGMENLSRGFEKSSPHSKPVACELVFTSEDIFTDFDNALKAGATEYEALSEKPWGQTVGYLRDNNGFLIELCTPMNGQ